MAGFDAVKELLIKIGLVGAPETVAGVASVKDELTGLSAAQSGTAASTVEAEA